MLAPNCAPHWNRWQGPAWIIISKQPITIWALDILTTFEKKPTNRRLGLDIGYHLGKNAFSSGVGFTVLFE